MSPYLQPFASMENRISCFATTCTEINAKMSSVTSVGDILLDEERGLSSNSSPSLPSLIGLALRIRAASLPALTELCIMAFDDDGSVLEAAINFPNVFFLMHKWFTTSESLARDLQRLFEQGKPSNSAVDYLSVLTSMQQTSSPTHQSSVADVQSQTSSPRPSSVILPRKQDDCNGNAGSRSPSLRTVNGRSNSVLIPRSACIGVEDDNYFSYHLSKLHAATLEVQGGSPAFGPVVDKPASSGMGELRCPDDCKHDKRTACQVYKFRRQVCQAVRFWVMQFPVHFDLDAKLSAFVKDWQKKLMDDYNCGELSSLVDLSCLPSYDWIRNISVRDPSVKHCRKVSLVFNHLEPSELAKHLTYLEHRTMRRISFQDYKQYAVTGSLSDNPRLERSVNLFNGLTQWVQCMVLSRSTPQQRAEVIVKLIDVTKILKEQRNFNSLMAVVGGLSHSSLARLARTAARVPPDSQRTLAELTEFLSSSSNFSNYRRALQECKGFKIPILGVHMKDLISLHVALSDSVEGGFINFRKMAQLSLIFQELQELQNATPPPGANVDLVNTLRLSLELAYTEDEIYELSLAREPRDSLSPQSSPTRPSLLGEWPTGGHPHAVQHTLMPNTANASHHLNTHDVTDRSALLPSESTSMLPNGLQTSDLEAAVLSGDCETDDGPSGPCNERTKKTLEERMNEMVDTVLGPPKHELLKRLQRSACQLSGSVDDPQMEPTPPCPDHPSPLTSQHDFQEASSFRPCTCAHCNGLLWGPLRQGYKCKECGLAAHKMCKDLINLSCRPKSLVPNSPFSDMLQGGSSRPRFRRRKKLNSQSDVDSLEAALLSMDCSCEITCPSPCRPPVQSASSCETTDFPDGRMDRPIGTASIDSGRGSIRGSDRGGSRGGGNESVTPLLTPRGHHIFRSPKRRSLVATGTSCSTSTFTTSPVPIRHRKTSLSLTSPCRSFPGTDPSIEPQPLRHSSLSTSPRRKISDALPIISSSPKPHRNRSCNCQGHH